MSPSKPLRIMFVVGSLGTGGAERFVSTAASLLDRSRYTCAAAVFREDNRYPLAQDVVLEVLGKYRAHHNPAAILRLARFVDRWKPDLVLSAWSFPNLFTFASLRLARENPAWIARVASPPERNELGIKSWMARLAYRNADGIIANSAGLLRSFMTRYGLPAEKGSVVLNPVDWVAIDEAAEAEPVARSDHALVMAMGRFSSEKRPDLIVEAFATVSRRHPECRFLWAGDGPLLQWSKERARELGLSDVLEFPGFLDNPHAQLARASVFVLASDNEGLPNALIEAQGLGVAAVSTDCDFGPSDIILDGETGYLTHPGDAGAIADAICRLLSEENLRLTLGSSARERARDRFAPSQNLPALESAVASALTRR